MLIMAGCAVQKSGNNTGKSTAEEVLYTQALKALEERNFIIHMLIKGAEKWQDRELIIILYKNTNQCFVNINRGHSGQNIVNFKGYVYPLATE